MIWVVCNGSIIDVLYKCCAVIHLLVSKFSWHCFTYFLIWLYELFIIYLHLCSIIQEETIEPPWIRPIVRGLDNVLRSKIGESYYYCRKDSLLHDVKLLGKIKMYSKSQQFFLNFEYKFDDETRLWQLPKENSGVNLMVDLELFIIIKYFADNKNNEVFNIHL